MSVCDCGFLSEFSCFRRLLGNKTHLKVNLVVFVLKCWLICCLFAADETFTVEEAVETIGFGRFHVLLFFIMGGASVRINQSINQLIKAEELRMLLVCL